MNFLLLFLGALSGTFVAVILVIGYTRYKVRRIADAYALGITNVLKRAEEVTAEAELRVVSLTSGLIAVECRLAKALADAAQLDSKNNTGAN